MHAELCEAMPMSQGEKKVLDYLVLRSWKKAIKHRDSTLQKIS
jgi:hypothetical protein